MKEEVKCIRIGESASAQIAREHRWVGQHVKYTDMSRSEHKGPWLKSVSQATFPAPNLRRYSHVFMLIE